MSVAHTFSHIIHHQSTAELVPFLLQLTPKEVAAVRQQAIALQHYGDSYREQGAMLFLAGLATYTRREALKTGFHWAGSLAHRFFYTREADVKTVLSHFRPDWLTDWVLDHGGRSLVDYWRLRWLHEQGFIDYRPEQFIRWLGGEALSSYKRKDLLPKLAQDVTVLQRDLPLLFEYLEAIASWDCHSFHDYDAYTWVGYLCQLAGTGHLDRTELLRRSLVTLRRDVRRPLLTWFKKLFLALEPSLAERLALQAELTELLLHAQPPVVNFALDQLKDLWPLPDFATGPALLHAEQLVSRPDLKTGVRTLLGELRKLLPHKPAAVVQLSVAALLHPDAGVQDKAAALLAHALSAPQTGLLTAEDRKAVLAGLASYADLLTPGARQALAPWLAAPNEAQAPVYIPYTARPDYSPMLLPAAAIAPVRDWHELLYLTGQVLRKTEPLQLERWLDGLLRLQAAVPPDVAEAVGPYVQELTDTVDSANWSDEEQWQPPRLRRPISPLRPDVQLNLYGHRGMVQGLFLSWAGGLQVRRVDDAMLRNLPYWTSDPLVFVEARRLRLVETRLQQGLALPLLSTPTHAPAWLNPAALMERLLAYESAHQEFDAADLALALARLAYGDTQACQVAAAQVPQLRHEPLRHLLSWALQPAPAPLPAAAIQAALHSGALNPTLHRHWPELWAVAARSKWPDSCFPELAPLLPPDVPEVAAPTAVSWTVTEQIGYNGPLWRTPRSDELTPCKEITLVPVPTPAPLTSDSLLLYSLQLAKWPEYAPSKGRQVGLGADFPLLASLLPQNRRPLYWHVLRYGASRNDNKPSATEPLQSALHALLEPGPGFDDAATLLLAAGLLHNAPGCQALAVEVLLGAIERQRLQPIALGQALGRLLAADFAPLARLASGVAKIRAVNFTTDDALRQLLETLLLELPDAPPRNTRKLLEAYADLTGRTQQVPSAAVLHRLQVWRGESSLRNIIRLLQ